MKKAFLFLARIAVVVVIYALILQRVAFENVPLLLTSGFYLALAGSVVLNLIQAVVCTHRWMLLARNVDSVPGFLPSYAAYLEGLFFNQALPSFVGGDAVRVVRWRSFGVATRDAIFSVMRDRLFGAIGAALIALLATALLLGTPVDRRLLLLAFLLALAALLGSTGVLVAMQSRRLIRFAARFPRVLDVLNRLRATRLDLKTWTRLSANALFGHALSGISVYLLAQSLGIDVPWLLLVSTTGIVLVVTMIPISLAGWGVREASFLALLVPLGAESERVMLLGIAFGFACLLSALLGGVSIMTGLASPSLSRPDQS